MIDPIRGEEGFYFWEEGKIERCPGFYLYDKTGVPIKALKAEPQEEEEQPEKGGGVLAGGLRFRYYPSLARAPVTPMTVSFFVVYFLLCLTPAALDLAAARQWRQIEKEVRR